jgi:hypothetical protein
MMFGLFKNKEISKVQPTRILVCTIADSSQFEQEALSDASIYKRYYPNVVFKSVQNANGFIDLIKSKEFDAVHIFGEVSQQGMAGGMVVKEIQDSCVKNGIKIIFWASGRSLNINMKHFKSGLFHLIVTLDRKGAIFATFLDGILSQLSGGKSLPLAWVNIAPPNPKSSANNLQPACVFSAGAGQMKFLP